MKTGKFIGKVSTTDTDTGAYLKSTMPAVLTKGDRIWIQIGPVVYLMQCTGAKQAAPV